MLWRQSLVGGDWIRRVSTVKRLRATDAYAHRIFFSPVHGLVLPTFRVGLPISVSLIQVISHRQALRCFHDAPKSHLVDTQD